MYESTHHSSALDHQRITPRHPEHVRRGALTVAAWSEARRMGRRSIAERIADLMRGLDVVALDQEGELDLLAQVRGYELERAARGDDECERCGETLESGCDCVPAEIPNQ